MLGRFFGSSENFSYLSLVNNQFEVILKNKRPDGVANDGRLGSSLNVEDQFTQSGQNTYIANKSTTENTSNNACMIVEDNQNLKSGDVEEMRKQSFFYFKLAADNGHPEAQFNVARMYRGGVGTVVDNIMAFKYYRLSADQGHPVSQCNLAIIYAKGIENVPETPNINEAVRYFELSAKQGNSKAQFNLGVLNASGIGGLA